MDKLPARVLSFLAAVLSLIVSAFQAHGAAIWSNPADGLWGVPGNWNGGLLPGLNAGTTFITNANSKVVTIDALTPATNLFINRMDISAPALATNTLFLQDVGTNNPLIVANNRLNLYRGSILYMTNSALVLTGRTSVEFNLWMGEVTLDSGLILIREEPVGPDVTVKARIGRTNVARLNINGGLFESSILQIGETPNPLLGLSHGTVHLRGGELKVHSELSIGDSASCTGIVEVTGGELFIPDNLTNITRIGNLGFGILRVTNATAFLNNVSVARHDGAVGLLLVQSNALVACSDDISIGRFSGGSGTVLVEGGRLALTNDTLWVGREGRGTLIISNGLVEVESLHVAIVPTNTARGDVLLAGGTLLVCSNFCLGDALLSIGQVLMTGGDFSVTNSDRTAFSSFPSGTMAMNGGTFTTDRLYVTNDTGRLTFNAGVLRTGNTTVSNGLPFTVGDGTNMADLHLLGGTHVFANTLVISSNATLTGCGTIIGAIVNHGTIATNCSVLISPVLTNAVLVGNTFRFSFQSVSGLVYTVEFKNDLNQAAWTPLQTRAGDGTQFMVNDPIMTNRFYRVRVE